VFGLKNKKKRGCPRYEPSLAMLWIPGGGGCAAGFGMFGVAALLTCLFLRKRRPGARADKTCKETVR